MAASFWSDPNLDPKRQYRFVAYFGGDIQPISVKTVKKPSFQVGVSKHQYLGHEFKYPTTVKWQDISMTVVDLGTPDTTKALMTILSQAGYTYPVDNKKTVSKQKFSGTGGAIGIIKIHQINSEGGVVEEWLLHNAFLSSVEFGQLSYASEDMVDITMSIVYDWAEITGVAGL